jgi:hypothetical protein
MSGFFVGDGYDVEGYIKEVEGLHPALRFRYRQNTATENGEWSRNIQNTPQKDADKLGARMVVKKLIDWNAPAEITELNISRLQPLLFEKLLLTVMGRRPHDPVPEGESPVDPALSEAERVKN